ncbi:pentatricopeptide repeat-containing protein At1g08070, chloroplastic-like isoform X2 [Wolffia australiana]
MALEAFARMLNDGSLPNCVTLSSVFKSCAGLRALKHGKILHGWILRSGIESDTIMINSMVDLYAKCGELYSANKVFDSMSDRDHTSWNIMIEAHLQSGEIQRSLDFFQRLPSRDVVSWNTVINGLIRSGCLKIALQFLYQMAEKGPTFSHFTFSMALSLVSSLSLLNLGREIHGRLLRLDLCFDRFIRCSLLDMYSKCGNMESAFTVFQSMSTSLDTISWSWMMAGYAHNQMHEKALEFFQRGLNENIRIDLHSLTTGTAICSYLGLLFLGMQLHAFAVKRGHASDTYLSSAIIDMYGKCGSLQDALEVFSMAKKDNLVIWTSMIDSYASHGGGREAIHAFNMMLESNITPNEVTFLSVMCACNHSGLVNEGYGYLKLMGERFGLVPGVEHLTCVVDLLCKAGYIAEAIRFIHENDISMVSASWKALLSACRVDDNFKAARYASEKLIKLGAFDVGNYLVLLKVCLAKGHCREGFHRWRVMEENGGWDRSGCSWLLLESGVHVFVAGDQAHEQIDEIVYCLDRLIPRLKGWNA